MPDFAAAARIKRIALIGAGYVHDTVRDNGRHLQAQCILQSEVPLPSHTFDVAFVNLRQLAITAACSRTVVSSPIALRCYLPITIRRLSQQVNLPVIAEQLQVGWSLVKH